MLVLMNALTTYGIIPNDSSESHRLMHVETVTGIAAFGSAYLRIMHLDFLVVALSISPILHSHVLCDRPDQSADVQSRVSN
jgi:hypothetical protein